MTPPFARSSVLFVCTGNICRSPTAEGLFRHRLDSLGVLDRFRIDSAGTGGWHEGDPPDSRAVTEALRRGIDIGNLRARALRPADYAEFSWLVAMDAGHLAHMQRACPRGVPCRILPLHPDRDVLDPYYGDAAAFRNTYDVIVEGMDVFMDTLKKEGLL